MDHARIGRLLAALVSADVRLAIATTPSNRVAVVATPLCAPDGHYVSGDDAASALTAAATACGLDLFAGLDADDLAAAADRTADAAREHAEAIDAYLDALPWPAGSALPCELGYALLSEVA